MEETLITIETAKLAQEKGCELITHPTYYASFSRHHNALAFCENYPDKLSYNITDGQDNEGNVYSCLITLNSFEPLPTQSLLQKWLRNLPTPIIVTPTTDFVAWEVEILHPDKGMIIITKNNNGRWFDSYEEALEIGLQQALKLIK